FAYEYLSEKKYLRFLVLVLLAGSFHITSLFAGIMLIISRFIKPTYKNLMISIFIVIVGYFSYKYLLTQFFTYSSIFSEYEKYLYLQDSYLDREYRVYSIIIYAIVFISLSMIILTKQKGLKDILQSRYEMISLLFIGIIINIIAIDYWVINRVALYMYQFIIVLIPAFLKVKMDRNEKKISVFLIIFIMINWFILFTILSGNNVSSTYRTYLFK